MKFKKISLKSEFGKNILTLMTGTTIAQAIPVAISPILTRIYTPDDFGLFALYMTFISIGAAIGTGKYEMAIILPKKDENAKYLFLISIFFSFIFSFIFLLFYLLFANRINSLFDLQKNTALIFFISFGIFLFALYTIMLQWMNRYKEYKTMTKNRFIQSSSIATFQLFIGFFYKASSGLILADILGRILAIVLIFKNIFSQVKIENFSTKKALYLIKRYNKFPKFEVLATVLNISAFQLPYVVLPILFSSVVAGLYFLVFRVLMMPISLIGNAILEVFKNRAMDDFNRYGSCRRIYKKIFLLLFLVGITPTFIILFFGEEIFGFVFGNEWQKAGVYAQILAPLAFLRLVSAPLSFIFFMRERLGLDLILQASFLIMTIVSFFIVHIYSYDIETLIYLLSISGCIFYIAQIIISYRLSCA